MCIMVVEDDPIIRLILVEELQDAGFDVREAATGDQAVEVLQTTGISPTILVTDVHMPGTRDGLDLADYVRRHVPGVFIIFTTGQPDALNKARVQGKHDVLIRKPYVPNDIIKRIHMLQMG